MPIVISEGEKHLPDAINAFCSGKMDADEFKELAPPLVKNWLEDSKGMRKRKAAKEPEKPVTEPTQPADQTDKAAEFARYQSTIKKPW